MKKLIAVIFLIAVSIAGCIGQDDSGGFRENPETTEISENTSVVNEPQGDAIEISPEANATEAETASTGTEVQKLADENHDKGYLEIFPEKTTVKLNGEIGQKTGNSYLGYHEGEVFHFYPEKIQIEPRYTAIKVKDGLHALHPEGLFFLKNDTVTIYSNNTVEEAEFPCDWNPPIQKPNPKGGLFNFYLPYMTANFTESEYRIDENRIFVPKGGHIFLYNDGTATYVHNGTELADNGCYFTLKTEKELSDQVVFERYIIVERVSFVMYGGETYLPEMFEN